MRTLVLAAAAFVGAALFWRAASGMVVRAALAQSEKSKREFAEWHAFDAPVVTTFSTSDLSVGVVGD